MNRDKFWMKEALKLAENGMEEFHELPIATILVAGEKEIGRGVTSNVRKNSLVAHGEQLVLMNTPKKVFFTCERPLVLYTTVEPCIMCIGAAIECGVDKIVYGMPAFPDGGACYAPKLQGVNERIPVIEGGLLEEEVYKLLKKFVETQDSSNPAMYYATEWLRLYKEFKNELR